ncbi:MarR family winged helix-turn-helix transcriptional regulator [Saccharothrix syringae]|uniref:MarR family transcriptional regulator n=1 Tax=Saccharothrix syringae TaxID=103733 RepID=A0A5Q0H7G3_SACSY|nr:MarR family winged helix-turn-helix transcriptional regulator [Saccharothrix syringae]QFZ22178.1 MarR family transcriptional regulator [Saccharothrix syringae]
MSDADKKPTSIPVPETAHGGRTSHAIFRVARLHRMLAGQLLRQAGLHPGQEMVMMHLWDCGPQRQADLCGVLDTDSATMTRTVQRLERAGFVRRTPDPHDGRATIVEPTVASQALRREVERTWRELEEATVEGLDERERAEVLRVLGVLECNLVKRTGRSSGPGAGAPGPDD